MQPEPDKTIETENQATKSILLIIAISIMTYAYMTCTYNREDDLIVMGALACPILTVLLGMYTFTYRGKAFLVSRVIFFIFLALSLLSITVLVYFIGLGNAYSH